MACTCISERCGITRLFLRLHHYARPVKPQKVFNKCSFIHDDIRAQPGQHIGHVYSSVRNSNSRNSQISQLVPKAAAVELLGLLDISVISAAAQASFKLLFLCGVVAWLSDKDMIPAATSQVMSKVAFSLTIPAWLFVSTTKTLTSNHSLNLIAIPAVAVAQIALGAAFGRWAAAAVEGKLWITRVLLGWGNLSPTPSAAAIAASTAAALRAPMAAAALLPKSKSHPDGLPQLVQLACSFGNTVTLPMMYLSTMLSAADASRAMGFMSLFHAAWSPCLWLFGYSSITNVAAAGGGGPKRRRRGVISQVKYLIQRMLAAARGSSSSSTSQTSSSSSSTFSPPSSQPAVLITKQLPPAIAGSASSAGSRAVYAVTNENDNVTSSYDETPAEALLQKLWAVVQFVMQLELIQKIRQAINPPVAAVITGVALGVSPIGCLISSSAAAAAFISDHATTSFTAWELRVLFGVLRCCWETVELLASGTLALQAIVLAASLFGPKQGTGSSSSSRKAPVQGFRSDQDPDRSDLGRSDLGAGGPRFPGTVEVESPGGDTLEFEGLASSDPGPGFSDISGSSSSVVGSSSSSTGRRSESPVITGISVTHRSANTADDASSSVISQLKPQTAWEWRAVLAVAAVRFVLLPCATTALMLAAMQVGVLPLDPVCAFMLLLQSCMPPAQNLVLIMQLQSNTAGIAPATARLLLQLYTLAIVPVTVWVSVFAKLLL